MTRQGRTLLAAALAGSLLLGTAACGGPADPCPDPLADRALVELRAFTGWLAEHDQRGVVGEVGWPADDRWQDVAGAWYAEAVDAGVGTFAWAGAEQWPADYPLAVYRGDAARDLDVAGEQARLVEEHADGTLRGVALADGSFGSSVDDPAYSATSPGAYGRDYRYPSRASLAFVADRGLTSVRLAFSWERVQPRPGGPLSEREVDRLREVLADAEVVGLDVVLDLHSYGRFVQGSPERRVLRLGSPELPADRLADVWQRLAGALGGSPAVAGYGLMNEPYDLPGGAAGWEAASREAVAAVRRVDRTTPVLVGGYAHSGAAVFAEQHARPWVPEGAGPVVYEAHQYFDGDRSGTYADPVDVERDRAEGQGFGGCA